MRPSLHRPALLVALALLLAGVSSQAAAVEPLDRFNARVGANISRFDTRLSADGETQAGTDIDLERDLDLGLDDTLGFIALSWRPFERHEFGVSYYNDGASASRKLGRDIEFDGTVYYANSTVRSEFKVDAYEINYVWWAASHDRWAMGPRAGLIWYKARLGLELELDSDGNEVSNSLGKSVDTDLPSPAIGAAWRWTPAQDWRISADVGYFNADLNHVDADITYGRLGVEWYPRERVGLLLDYTMNRIDAAVDQSGLHGDVKLDDSGLRLGVAYRF
jgi:hypothetical protein